ncbi:MAG TPA: hypothetical protein VKB60_00040, partial [Terriglobales bacterium]|nr:hypothetical protein [Terriglobales bacterium]
MGTRLISGATIVLANTTVTLNTLTLALVTPALSPVPDGSLVKLIWYLVILTGAGTTSWVVRLHRGALATDTVINAGAGLTTPASTLAAFSGCYVDTPAAVAGQQYSLT